MQSLGLVLRKRGDEGSALPVVFERLEKMGAKFRRGQVSLVAAAPNTGKSAFAGWIAVKGNVPTLWLSPDSDRMTLGARVLSMLTNTVLEESEVALEEDDEDAYRILDEEASHIWFSFDPGPSCEDIFDEMRAYAHVMGAWPQLVIVDNLKDIRGHGDNQENYHQTIDFLHEMARKTGAHVLVLHHVKGHYENGLEPIPLQGLLNNVGKTTRLVLTLHRASVGVTGVRIVKNNNGPAGPAGDYGIDMAFMAERMWWGG